jgi:hypothetical protein
MRDLQTELGKLPQVEPITENYFAGGMYCRMVFRNAGTLVVGKVHKKEHFFILIDGEMSVWTEEGYTRAVAPHVWVSPIGTKRVTYAHTNATAMTVHQVSTTDVDKVDDELVEDDPSANYGPGNLLLPEPLENPT